MSGISSSGAGSGSGYRRSGRRRKKGGAFTLQITSLMDVLIIIVIFLLKSYGISQMQVAQPDKLELPVSKATEAFGEGIVLVMAQDQILIDNEPVLQFMGDFREKKFELPEASAGDDGTRGILPIYDVLKRKREEFETLASRSANPAEALKQWTGDLFLQADKEVPYELIRKVMFTAGMAGYKQFRLTVEKQVE